MIFVAPDVLELTCLISILQMCRAIAYMAREVQDDLTLCETFDVLRYVLYVCLCLTCWVQFPVIILVIWLCLIYYCIYRYCTLVHLMYIYCMVVCKKSLKCYKERGGTI